MAASEAAASPALGGRADRPSPLPASQSKRDRKRQMVMERLAVLTERFQHDKDSVYRDQLQRIQFELNKLQKIDPYASDAVEVANEIQKEYKQALGTTVRAENARSLMDMAGMQFPQFMTDIQDVLEARDFHLTLSKSEYERKIQEYRNTHSFKVETAKREHEALNSTMRDRLINQLNTKKARLNKEKEAFEISDTNALLLNPAQFSLTNPGSPSGHTGKRSTRNRKDADDGHGYGDSKKRKRNGGDDDGSPAPSRRALEANATTPYWQSEKARNEARKQGAVYTISSLFTEKELSMHYNTAALAAHNHILRHRASGCASSPEASDSGNGEDMAEEAPAAAPAMERQPSHATRSTRVAATHNLLDDKVMGVEGNGIFELPPNLDLLQGAECNPRMPTSLPNQYIKNPVKSVEPTAPGSLSEKEVTSDLHVMACLKQYDHARKPGSHLDDPKGVRKTFETMSMPYQTGQYVPFTRPDRDDGPDAFRDTYGTGLAPTTSSVRDQISPGRSMQPLNGQLLGGTTMSRQSSAGGVAMSRQGTAGSGRGKTRRA
ncbi:hypothetical protein HIM_05574 [Hirsutella minnesotensis 3608]|uniref:Nif-specific regulatory protein n=1 Tax=Hirsutella minnesotensis 3608 TaxID=1043627 RepID=A0A0F7ZUL8_9HYPO|nr:hypothetical protein HIM_05574 [Hirsutella minnesotensis 3608]